MLVDADIGTVGRHVEEAHGIACHLHRCHSAVVGDAHGVVGHFVGIDINLVDVGYSKGFAIDGHLGTVDIDHVFIIVDELCRRHLIDDLAHLNVECLSTHINTAEDCNYC